VPAAVTPRKKPRSGRPGEGTGEAWRVIVLNDNHNTFEGVAFSLASVLPSTSFERGLELANQIHSSGRAIVWSGHKEAAELYWTQLRDHGLTMAPLEN
jgi:ATP-dependent Clp protease adaptor protein ClpS